MTIVTFVAGLFIGATIGVFAGAVMSSGSREDLCRHYAENETETP